MPLPVQVNSPKKTPTIPRLFTWPLGFVPAKLQTGALTQILNRVFAPELSDGELDFLDEKVMRIRVEDVGLEYRLTLTNGKLRAAQPGQAEDLSIEGNAYEFLLLATRQEDPDTLFFNRRLRLGGSTELGLYVKNFLDGLELEPRLGPLLPVMKGATSLMGRLAR
ncbi:ubiquinone anaerobic biosynthesis accessory factor UbiT [Thiorhodovibrio frisius]|uniref:Ubiquinone biosynthesis accessory factor UbiT n=1 Tax=Thiorhodovibrio frisius TaxID=631362 RepID=H8Z879_9GAMM|nr:SCP2 sterol-binding domain-containing protein [Thiorhodovibrio frisius]EIC21028.1 putative lipid carrier protein [Thiorhodovibrio frisius]WPL22084.1 Putative lipid carrier protein [Thiorhodovibrio frisius]